MEGIILSVSREITLFASARFSPNSSISTKEASFRQ
jgi:hypothetical protein